MDPRKKLVEEIAREQVTGTRLPPLTPGVSLWERLKERIPLDEFWDQLEDWLGGSSNTEVDFRSAVELFSYLMVAGLIFLLLWLLYRVCAPFADRYFRVHAVSPTRLSPTDSLEDVLEAHLNAHRYTAALRIRWRILLQRVLIGEYYTPYTFPEKERLSMLSEDNVIPTLYSAMFSASGSTKAEFYRFAELFSQVESHCGEQS